mgnify:FL=1
MHARAIKSDKGVWLWVLKSYYSYRWHFWQVSRRGLLFVQEFYASEKIVTRKFVIMNNYRRNTRTWLYFQIVCDIIISTKNFDRYCNMPFWNSTFLLICVNFFIIFTCLKFVPVMSGLPIIIAQYFKKQVNGEEVLFYYFI